jgi:farnesyl-diphosphate farnesyltransferase
VLGEQLSGATLPEEHGLVASLPEVLAVTRGFPPGQREPIARCARVMAGGMLEFQQSASPRGLADLAELDRYCYYVAGVVGEMLTDLFAEYHPEVAGRREELRRLSVSFGQGLQMTNILKDIWTDHRRGVCWLPRSEFDGGEVGLAQAAAGRDAPAFRAGLLRLVAVAKSHLDGALRYVLALPPGEDGMRRFCLYALGMAILTLQKIRRRPGFRDGDEVKISRRAVRRTVAAVNATSRWNPLLRALYAAASAGLPR